ncbi:MAG: hypothetical protein H6953_06395 [Chromatiaceae bacterium]|nr:hypothetical protein [Gammaproteobacteria bacterium]MCP5305057.1 hypothetical protein [Chromatiaceae bacterium]MCP5315016.1 hypothetical protein [Chromatiaceae bacterium]
MNTRPVKTVLILAASAALFGCATANEKDLRTELAEVRAIAEQAAADAAVAKQAAADARDQSDAAMNAASAAQSQSEQTEAKIDRMFKKAMYK